MANGVRSTILRDDTMADIIDAISDALDYFEDRSDADYDDVGYLPNKEMLIAKKLSDALKSIGHK